MYIYFEVRDKFLDTKAFKIDQKKCITIFVRFFFLEKEIFTDDPTSLFYVPATSGKYQFSNLKSKICGTYLIRYFGLLFVTESDYG